MKREVDSTLVDKGVAERVRLTQAFEKRRDELTRQHESVKNALKDFRTKVGLMFFKLNYSQAISYIFRQKQYLTKKQTLVSAFCQTLAYQTYSYQRRTSVERPQVPRIMNQQQTRLRQIKRQATITKWSYNSPGHLKCNCGIFYRYLFWVWVVVVTLLTT